jgi:outer membrane protein assembly factor BamB
MRNVWLPSLLIALFACGPVAASTPGRKSGPRFEIDAQGRVVRLDTAGKTEWAARLNGKLGGREPQLLWDVKRLYVRHNDGVTALAARTGVVLWHEKGINGQLALCSHLLLSTRDSCVTARAVSTGAEVWKYRLPKGVVAGFPWGEDWVFLQGEEVVRLSPGGKPCWRTEVKELAWFSGGGLLEAGGDLVAFAYGPHSGGGVDVARLNAATGRVVWRARCSRLGVGHSRYFHEAAVTVEGDHLRVTSESSYGTFVEVLDLKTGKRLKRTERKN